MIRIPNINSPLFIFQLVPLTFLKVKAYPYEIKLNDDNKMLNLIIISFLYKKLIKWQKSFKEKYNSIELLNDQRSNYMTCYKTWIEKDKRKKKQSDQSNQESVIRLVWLIFKLNFVKNWCRWIVFRLAGSKITVMSGKIKSNFVLLCH